MRHSMRLKNNIIAFGLVVANFICLASVCLGEQGPTVEYDGHILNVRDLVGISWSTQQPLLASAVKQFPFNRYPPLSNSCYEPATHPTAAEYPSTKQYYQNQLNGAFECFLDEKVYELFRKKYPFIHPKRFLRDDATIDNCIQQSAHLNQVYMHCVATYLISGQPAGAFVPAIQKAIPCSTFKAADWLRCPPAFRAVVPYMVIQATCFPSEINGKAVPWFRSAQLAGLLQYYITQDAIDRKQKYIDLVNDKLGQRDVLFITDPNPISMKALDHLAKSVSDKSGNPEHLKIFLLNKMFCLMDSGAHIQVQFGAGITFKATFGLPIAEQIPGKIIRITAAPNRDEGYVYFTPASPKSANVIYSPYPGSFMYDAAHDYLLRPLVHEVLAKVKAQKPWTIPTEDELLNRVTESQFIAHEHGVTLKSPVKPNEINK